MTKPPSKGRAAAGGGGDGAVAPVFSVTHPSSENLASVSEKSPLLPAAPRAPPPSAKLKENAGQLSLPKIVGYAAGTILNDMTASLWFAFLIFSLQERGMGAGGAATVILSGQVADGLFTPFAGVLSDSTSSRFGKRFPYIVGGSLTVGLSFVFIFTPLPGAEALPPDSRALLEVVYFSLLAAVFNFGWASVQVAHMALVPELSSDDFVRLRLNSMRFAFTVASNIAVFALAWASFHFVPGTRAQQLEVTAWSAVAIGSVGVLTCLASLHSTWRKKTLHRKDVEREGRPAALPLPTSRDRSRSNSVAASDAYRIPWTAWFKLARFYSVGFIFMCARLIVVLTQCFMPFFLVNMLQRRNEELASVPLLLQVASLCGSFWFPYINRGLGLKAGYGLGAILVMVASAGYFYMPPRCHCVYPITVVLGLGTAGVAVTAMMLEAVVVGEYINSAAFVYGSYGLLEKISSGMGIFLLERFFSTTDGASIAMSIVPGVAAVASAFVLLFVRVPSCDMEEGGYEEEAPPQVNVIAEDGEAAQAQERAQAVLASDLEAHSAAPSRHGHVHPHGHSRPRSRGPSRGQSRRTSRLPSVGDSDDVEALLPNREYFPCHAPNAVLKMPPFAPYLLPLQGTTGLMPIDWESAASLTCSCL